MNNRLRIGGALLVAAIMVGASAAHAQQVVFVKQNTPSGDNGMSWSTAYDDLWTCLDDLPTSGNFDIHVAAGTYRPPLVGSGPIASFPIRNGVRIFGGFPGLDELEELSDRLPNVHVVVLSGDVLNATNVDCMEADPNPACGDPESGACDQIHGTPGCDDLACCSNVCCFDPSCCESEWDMECVDAISRFCGSDPQTRAEHVVVTTDEGEIRRLDGVTVRDGGKEPTPFDDGYGGGIWVIGDSFEDLVSLEVVRCTISNNYAALGGGIAVTTREPTTYEEDEAAVRIWNCRIERNEAKNYGGGLMAFGRSSYEVVNSVIAFNGYDPLNSDELTQGVQGAAISENINVEGVPRSVINSTITRNAGPGPGIFQAGLSFLSDELRIVNSIVRGNFGVIAGELVECVDPEDCDEIDGLATRLYSNINEAPAALPITCINVDPQFEDGPNGDFRLLEGSLCVDAGDDWEVLKDDLDVNNNGFTVSEDGPDLALKFRVRVGSLGACPRVDMGAHELQGFCKLGDLNDDDAVDGSDTGLFLGLWGPCTTTPCPGDFNCDGVVDSADPGLLMGGWGPGIPRTCGTESLLGGGSEGFSGGSEQSETSGLSLQQLSDALGFPSMNAFVDWVVTLPFAEMEFYLSMIG